MRHFEMRPPGTDAITAPLREVRPDTRFHVSHELQARADGGTRIVYSIRIDGPEAALLGPLVTADGAEVLAALRALAGRGEAEVS